MTRIIALTALAALGLAGGPVHEPVHAWGQAIRMAVTQRDTIKIRRLICMAWPYRSSPQGVESGAGGSRLGRLGRLGQPAGTPAASKRHLNPAGKVN